MMGESGGGVDASDHDGRRSQNAFEGTGGRIPEEQQTFEVLKEVSVTTPLSPEEAYRLAAAARDGALRGKTGDQPKTDEELRRLASGQVEEVRQRHEHGGL